MFFTLILPILSQNKHVLDYADSLDFAKASGNYADNNYVNSNRIQAQYFTYTSNGDNENYPLSNAFDGSDGYWAAKEPNTETFHNSIFITFDKEAKIEAILHDASYSTNGNVRNFRGFPLVMNVYTSLSDTDPYRLVATFSGDPGTDPNWGRTQFVFLNPILCKRLQIEFIEVTEDDGFSNGAKCPVAKNIYFIGDLQFDLLSYDKGKNNYAVNDYLNSHRIPKSSFTYDTNGDKSANPKTYLFDENTGTYWTSDSPASDTFKPSVFVNFTQTSLIEGLVFRHAYNSNGNLRTYQGFVNKLTVYTAVGDRPLSKHTVFEGEIPTTTAWGDYTQYVFKSAVSCDRIQIEFTEVTANTYTGGGQKCPVMNELYIIKPETEGSLPLYPAAGDLANDNYVSTHKIQTSDFTYATNGDKENFPASFLFDNRVGAGNDYWISNEYSDSFIASIYVNFSRMVILESILNYHAYGTSGNQRTFHGFAKVFKVYTSSNDDGPLTLYATFKGDLPTSKSWTRTQYAFNAPVHCKRIQLEFTEVSPDSHWSQGQIRAVSNEIVFIGTIYPVPTQSPTPPPTRSPVPTRSPYPGTLDTYIDKTFEGVESLNGVQQIQAGSNNINQISGCYFHNIQYTNRNYYIKILSEILFYDNIFENDEKPSGDSTGIIWSNYNGRFTITNCKFIRIASNNVNGFVINVNSNPSNNVELVIERSEFIDCGKSGSDRPLIDLINDNGIFKSYDCNFTFSSSSYSFKVLKMNNNNAIIDGCRFTRCNTDTIKIGTSGNDPTGTFIFTNNYITSNNGSFISADKLRSIPTIENNIFEDITLSNSYLISISHNQNEIELTNNTFSKITSSGTSNSDWGGASVSLTSSSNEYTIKYTRCKFNSNTNNHETSLNRYGGAIEYGFSTTFNAALQIIDCQFKGNKAKHHGGGIALRTSKSVIIRGCEFESNIASNEGASSQLLFENHYDNKEKGCGGAIYINPSFNEGGQDYSMSSVTISGCIFTSNRAYQGYAIYIEGEECQTTFLINGNNQFGNNEGTETHPELAGIIASEIFSLNKEDIKKYNQFFGTAINNVEQILFVDHYGNPPSQTASVSQSPTQSATESPTQSATESATQSATESPTQSATESPTESATESPTQSATETPTQSATESPTQSATESPTESPTQSATESPTQSATETPTQSATETPTETPTQSATESPTETPTESATESASQSPAESPSQSSTESPSPTQTKLPTPDSPTYVEEIFYDDSNYTDNNEEQTRIEKVIFEDDTSNIAITVKKSNFTNIENNDGGAIHLENCGLKTDGTTFTECKSNEGGGGAIFIKNSNDAINDVSFKNLNFIKCKAEYGGAAYIYSSIESNKVVIELCNFIQNVATKTESSNGLFGGSAIFMSTKKGRVRLCQFDENDVKLYNDYQETSKSHVLEETSAFTFTDCQFNINKNSKCSIFYYGANSGTSFALERCTFSGNLKEGAYFIDGQLANKNSPKLIVKTCRFSSTSIRAVNQNGYFASINLKDQEFEFDQFDQKQSAKKNLTVVTIASVSVVAVIAALITTVVIIIKKRTNPNVYSKEQDGIEMNSQSRDITESSLVAPLI